MPRHTFVVTGANYNNGTVTFSDVVVKGSIMVLPNSPGTGFYASSLTVTSVTSVSDTGDTLSGLYADLTTPPLELATGVSQSSSNTYSPGNFIFDNSSLSPPPDWVFTCNQGTSTFALLNAIGDITGGTMIVYPEFLTFTYTGNTDPTLTATQTLTVTITVNTLTGIATSILVTPVDLTNGASLPNSNINGIDFAKTNVANNSPFMITTAPNLMETTLYQDNIFNAFNADDYPCVGIQITGTTIQCEYSANVGHNPKYPIVNFSGTYAPIPYSNGLFCFAEGTRLLTVTGYKAVETLTSNDRLLTTENRAIRFAIMRTHIPKTYKHTAPYRIEKDALGENMPMVPLYVSPKHKFALHGNVWAEPPVAATLNPGIRQCTPGTPMTYYHVVGENYARDAILAEGVVTETYGNVKDNVGTFKWDKHTGLFYRNEYKERSQSHSKSA